MPTAPLELPGSERAELRAAVAALDRQIASLSARSTLEEYRAGSAAVTTAWTELVKLFALGDPPALRQCPRCKNMGMRDATRCGYCWLALPPLG